MSGKNSLAHPPTDAPTYSPAALKFDWYINSVPIGLSVSQMWVDSNSQYLYLMGGTLQRMDMGSNVYAPFAGSIGDDDGLNNDDGGQATSAKFGYGSGVFGNSVGDLYVSDYSNCVVRVVDSVTGVIKKVAAGNGCGYGGDFGDATSAMISSAENLTGDTDGNLFIADGNKRIRRVTSAGIITTYAGGGTNYGEIPATSAGFNQPQFISMDTSGRLYISDRSACRVYVVSTSGILSTVAGTGTIASGGDGGPANQASINYAYGSWPSTDGYLYVSDYWGHRIRMVDTNTGLITTVVGNGVSANTGNGGKATAASINNPMAIHGAANGLIFLSIGGGGLRVLSASSPSVAPSIIPTDQPTTGPSQIPTVAPSPSHQPVLTTAPSTVPSSFPLTSAPSCVPFSSMPSFAPFSSMPSLAPSRLPTLHPTYSLEPTTLAPSASPSPIGATDDASPNGHSVSDSSSSSGGNNSVAGVVGGVVGGLGGLLLILGLLYWFRWQRSTDKKVVSEIEARNRDAKVTPQPVDDVESGLAGGSSKSVGEIRLAAGVSSKKSEPEKIKYTDVFLTHDWGTDELDRDNHARVARVNDALKRRGIVTWFDAERMTGSVRKKMTDGIERTSVVIVFVTDRYRNKVNGSEERDNCRYEFTYAVEQKGPQSMVAVVMEPRMRNSRLWKGELGAALGNKLFIDMVEDEESVFESRCNDLAAQVRITMDK